MIKYLKYKWQVIFLVVGLLNVSQSVWAQSQPAIDLKALESKIQQSGSDTNKVNLLLELSRFYVNKRFNADSALIFAKKALGLSEQLKFPGPINSSLRLVGGIMLRKKQVPEAMLYFNRITNYYKAKGLAKEEAGLYFFIGRQLSTQQAENIALKISFFEKAGAIYQRLNLFDSELDAKNYITRIHLEQGKTALAEKEFLEQLAYAKSKKLDGSLRLIYFGLSELAELRGENEKLVYYYLEILKINDSRKESLGNNQWKNQTYWNLARAYGSLKKYQESEATSNLGMELSLQIRDYDMFYHHLNKLGDIYFFQRKFEQAIAAFNKALQKVPPQNDHQNRIINKLFGRCYLQSNRIAEAEPYFLAMDKFSQNMAAEFNNASLLEGYEFSHNVDMASFYLTAKKYDKANVFLNKLMKVRQYPKSQANLLTILGLQLRADTAVGDFSAAFRHLNDYKRISDSINTVEKDRAVADLMIKYETEKKDKDLLLQRQSIDILTKKQQIQNIQLSRAALQIQIEKEQRKQQESVSRLQSERQEKDLQFAKYETERKDSRISLLNKHAQIQQASLEKSKLIRNMTVGGLLLTLAILVLVVRSYRSKQIINKQLKAQKSQIDQKNEKLQRLVHEREWLLKELHHRVKNNLQTVMSLLSNQSAFIQDKPALNAILDSQHRVHAMALIHQKLYNHEIGSSIDISAYVEELVSYLSESFDAAHPKRYSNTVISNF